MVKPLSFFSPPFVLPSIGRIFRGADDPQRSNKRSPNTFEKRFFVTGPRANVLGRARVSVKSGILICVYNVYLPGFYGHRNPEWVSGIQIFPRHPSWLWAIRDKRGKKRKKKPCLWLLLVVFRFGSRVVSTNLFYSPKTLIIIKFKFIRNRILTSRRK